jgi:hypothetical protein
MTTSFMTLLQKSASNVIRLGLFGTIAVTLPSAAYAQATNDSEHMHASSVPAKLVQAVREATKQYVDVNAATAAGYKPFLGCVTGPDAGAMGVHYVNGDLVSGGEIDVTRPQALIYEPSGGEMRLVGVEFIALSAPWLAHNPAPPVLEDQVFQFIDAPNRYGLPALFELHVWAWRDNPHGAFVDWNTHVTCEQE